MAITLLTGVPGSGKSYFAVNKIVELLDTKDNFLILSNIDGTKENIFDRRYVFHRFSLEFLRNANMENFLPHLRDEHHLDAEATIYIFIDECQNYYGPSCRDEDAFYFLDYHRHYGVEIFLITQKDTKIRKEVEALCETEIRGLPPTLSLIPGMFVYNHKCGGEIFAKIKLKKKSKVFSAYKSFQAGTIRRGNYTIWLRVLVPLLIAVAAGYYTINNLTKSKKSKEAVPPVQSEMQTQQSKPAKPEINQRVVDSGLEGIPVDKPKKPQFQELEHNVLEYFDILEYSDWMITIHERYTGNKLRMNFYEFINRFPPSPVGYSYMVSQKVLLIFVDGGRRVLEFRNDVAQVGVSRDPTITTVGKRLK